MEGRVPGGQTPSLSVDSITASDATGYVPYDTENGLKQGSKSLPRYTVESNGFGYSKLDNQKSKTIGMDSTRKGKLSATLSLATLVKNVKKLSNLSLNTSSPKPQKRSKSLSRSKSVNRKTEDSILQMMEPIHKKINGGVVCFEDDKIPGLIGLKNHGNTCFMNAVIQCLSNTELLTEYFVTDQYKQDLRGKNKYNAKKYGTKGELTQHLSRLFKSLWMRQYSPSVSSDLKAIVGKYGPQYRGYSQHDAQEFLLWLLDKIHEDLNIAPKKKYKTSRVIHGRTDDAAAAEVLANHTRCHNSYVYDLFQALYKSSLQCPSCHHISNTFDPFLSVSLPIPQRSKKAVYVTVVYLDAKPKQVRIGLLQDPGDTVRELRHALSCDTNIPEDQLILTEIFWDGFHRTFNDSQQLTELKETDNIYAIETLPPIVTTDDADEVESDGGGGVVGSGGLDTESSSGYIQLVLLNTREMNASQFRRFGGPFVIQVQRELSFLELQEVMLQSMSAMLNEGVLDKEEYKDNVLFRLKVCDGTQGKSYLSDDVEHPLFMEYIERALSICVPGGGPEHVKLLLEWTLPTKDSVMKECNDNIEEHSSVKQAKQLSQEPVTGTLDECFQTYTQAERLEYDNLWFCPSCRQKQQGTTKAISLWSLPDILVIHLKRFRQTTVNRTKVDTLITFPLNGLDMSKRIDKKHGTGQTTNNNNNKGAMTGWSPWRPNRKAPNSPEDYVYDLYGVVNHYGNMQGGHYTAFCKSPATGKWYKFDDVKVTEVSESEINSSAAYLLFYQRRTANNVTVYNSEHWLHTVAKINFIEPQTRHSQSQEDLLDDDDNSKHEDSDGPHFIRNTNPYATMRPPNTRTSPQRYTSHSTVQENPVNSALAGSPSMGSLGLVDLCSEPTRKVRHDSQNNHVNNSTNITVTNVEHQLKPSPSPTPPLPPAKVKTIRTDITTRKPRPPAVSPKPELVRKQMLETSEPLDKKVCLESKVCKRVGMPSSSSAPNVCGSNSNQCVSDVESDIEQNIIKLEDQNPQQDLQRKLLQSDLKHHKTSKSPKLHRQISEHQRQRQHSSSPPPQMHKCDKASFRIGGYNFNGKAPKALAESFDSCSRSPSLNHSGHGSSGSSPHTNGHYRRSHHRSPLAMTNNEREQHNRQQQNGIGDNRGRYHHHRDFDLNSAGEQNGLESSDDSISMDAALNEQKLISILENNVHVSVNKNRRQLPKTPPMKPAIDHHSNNKVQYIPQTHYSSNTHDYIHQHDFDVKRPCTPPLITNDILDTDNYSSQNKSYHRSKQNRQAHNPPTTTHSQQQSPVGSNYHHPPITTVTQLNGPLRSKSSPPQLKQAGAIDRTQDEHFRTVRRDNKDKTPDRELQTWDYNQTVYLQESCV